MKNIWATKQHELNTDARLSHFFTSWKKHAEVTLRQWWNLPCLLYLFFNYSSCFLGKERTNNMGARPNFEKRALASVQGATQPSAIGLHDAKSATVYWLSHMKTESQSLHGCSCLFTQFSFISTQWSLVRLSRMFSDLCLHLTEERRGDEYWSCLISA